MSPDQTGKAKGSDEINSLGDALAGVSIGVQSQSLGPAALANETPGVHVPGNGWGDFSVTSDAFAQPPGGDSNESLHQFLSQDPSQSLGVDAFTLSQPGLSALGYRGGVAGTYNQQYYSETSGGDARKNGFMDDRPTNEPLRRHVQSPSGTGTAASSRSASPYSGEHGVNIQAYNPPNPLARGTIDPKFLDHKQEVQGKPAPLPHAVPPQGQMLYMAVPSPDGHGQIYQPVQVLQMPGKPYSYAVPNADVGRNYFGDTSQQHGMIVLPVVPPAGHAVDHSRTGARPYEPRNDTYHDSEFGIDAAGLQTQQRPSLESLLGQVRRLSRDQVGCRLVQQALDEEGPQAATLILKEGLPFWGEAMVDPFGNYLFQKVLEKVTAKERIVLVKSVSSRLVNASLNLHGTRSVQKVVEICAEDVKHVDENETQGETAAGILTASLTPAAARLCIDSHGNHVIQRILLKLDPKYSKFIFDAVASNVSDVARHRHGCCVIQRCLDSPVNDSRTNLVERIVESSLELMQDAYGNYVVQYVLDVCSDQDVQAVCESVVGKVNLLAIQKFSSNVMEKCLERCSDSVKELYLKEMSDQERIRELMMDPFGNYVVQRALAVSTHSQAIRLVEAMRPHLLATHTGLGQRNGGVRNTAGGRRIIAKICRRFPNFTLTPLPSQDDIYGSSRGVHRNPPNQHYSQGFNQHRDQVHHSHLHHPPVGNRDQFSRAAHPSQPVQPHYTSNANPGYYNQYGGLGDYGGGGM